MPWYIFNHGLAIRTKNYLDMKLTIRNINEALSCIFEVNVTRTANMTNTDSLYEYRGGIERNRTKV